MSQSWHISYLLLCNKLLPKLVPENNKHVSSHDLCESETWERLGCVSPEAAVKVLPGLHLPQGQLGEDLLPSSLTWLLAGLANWTKGMSSSANGSLCDISHSIIARLSQKVVSRKQREGSRKRKRESNAQNSSAWLHGFCVYVTSSLEIDNISGWSRFTVFIREF